MADQTVRSSGISSGLFYGYIIVIASLLLMIVTQGTRPAYGVFFKPMSSDFNWSRALTSGAFSLSAGIEGTLGVFLGWLNDRFGPRVVLTLCGFLVGVGYLLMYVLGGAWHLYLFYGVILAIGMGGSYVPLLSTVARWFVGRRSMMTGIVVAGIGIGALIVPPVTERLISALGWRFSYLILGSVVLVIGMLAAQFLRQDPSEKRQQPYGNEESRVTSVQTSGFSFSEAWHTRQFWLLFGMMACLGYTVFTALVHIVPHATDLGISAMVSAGTLSAMGVAGIAGNVLLGGVADRIGNKRAFIIGFALTAVAYFILMSSGGVWMIYLFVVLFGLAHGGMGASESPITARLFGLRSHGLIFGAVCFGFTIGASLGPYLTGYFFDMMESYKVAFMVCAIIGVVGLILAALITPMKMESGKNRV